MEVVEIREEPIELYKVLKLANIAASGGEAKMLVAEGMVKVNGAVETRKRKKIFAGDIVELEGIEVRIQLQED